MEDLKLSFASWDYDRIQALSLGTVKPVGIQLLHLSLPVEEIFWRLTKHQEFDVSEMSFSSYLIAKERGLIDYTAIPVFPSRYFRHSCVFVHAGSGIEKPEDLKGKRIGVPEYQMTAALWIRGFLEHDYQVKAKDVQWLYGGVESPGREEKIVLDLPKEISIQAIPNDATLNQMLENGEIDALITARAPSHFLKGSPNIKRLFPNSKEVEQAYYKRTKLFPIMHTVLVRNTILKEHPWVANDLLKAFELSKQKTYEGYKQTAALKTTIPWQVDAVNEAIEIMGEDFWPYGMHKNRAALEAITQYSYEQGLTKKHWKPEEIFVSSTFDEFVI